MHLQYKAVTILNTATESDIFYVGNGSIEGIYTPAGWTAADISFEAAPMEDDGSEPAAAAFKTIVDEAGAPINISGVAVDEFIALQQDGRLCGMAWCRLVSSVAQGADRALTVVVKL